LAGTPSCTRVCLRDQEETPRKHPNARSTCRSEHPEISEALCKAFEPQGNLPETLSNLVFPQCNLMKTPNYTELTQCNLLKTAVCTLFTKGNLIRSPIHTV